MTRMTGANVLLPSYCSRHIDWHRRTDYPPKYTMSSAASGNPLRLSDAQFHCMTHDIDITLFSVSSISLNASSKRQDDKMLQSFCLTYEQRQSTLQPWTSFCYHRQNCPTNASDHVVQQWLIVWQFTLSFAPGNSTLQETYVHFMDTFGTSARPCAAAAATFRSPSTTSSITDRNFGTETVSYQWMRHVNSKNPQHFIIRRS